MTSSDQYDKESKRQAWAIYQESLRLNRFNKYAAESHRVAQAAYDAHLKLRLAQKNSPSPSRSAWPPPAPKLGFWATIAQNRHEASQQRWAVKEQRRFQDRILELRYGPQPEPSYSVNYIGDITSNTLVEDRRRLERGRIKAQRYAEAIRLYGYTERGLRHAGI